MKVPTESSRPDLTPTGLRKFRRNAAIVVLKWFGFTVDSLADIFDLDPTMVRRIVRSGGNLAAET